jgi:type I restriction enzyme S subunit
MNLLAPGELNSEPKLRRGSPLMDSGVEGIGKIPAHWEVRRLKHVVKLNLEVLPEDTPPDYSLQYLDIGNVDSEGHIVSIEELSFAQAPSRARRKVREGDTIISTVRTYLKAISFMASPPDNLIVSTGFAVLRPLSSVYPKFLWRMLQSIYFIDAVVSHSEGVSYPAISPTTLSTLPVWIPPLSEQQAIANFLDRETAKIDALVAKKERLIELLQEKRAALITRAVTKGLDSKVSMKDSGVDWLGKIPAHWEATQIRNIAKSLQTGPFGSQLHSEDYTPGGIPVLNPSHLRDGYLVPDMDCAVDEGTAMRLKQHELCEGDIIFARRGEMGRCALVTKIEAGWLCGTGSLRIRPNLNLVDPSFLNRFLSISGIREWLLLEAVGATMDNLNTMILGRMPVLLPPVDEQRAISTFCDVETNKIDTLVAKVREGIEKLQEYRTALISAAVTGKIDVRGYAGATELP